MDRLLDQYGAWLRRTLSRLCPRDLPVDVDDVYQEVSIKLWKILQSEKEIDHLPSYLYRVASTVTIDAVRKAMATAAAEVEVDAELGEQPEPPRASLSPESLVSDAVLADAVQAIVNGLAENRRRAVSLHLQGFTTREIADLMRWREPKARNLVYRGLKQLRAALEERGLGR